jgi:hypothetical protein
MSHTNQLEHDKNELRELNLQIATAESNGDREWLASILAPHLAFQRADKMTTVDDQNAFLWKVKAGGPKTTDILDLIQLFGNRAIVQCIVTVGEQKFHNLRLWVRRGGEWKLLGWANEELSAK